MRATDLPDPLLTPYDDAQVRFARTAALRWLQDKRPFDPAHQALGVLPPETRVDAFYASVEDLVVPRLTQLGLDGAAAWESRYRA
jgi:hypothetical protein